MDLRLSEVVALASCANCRRRLPEHLSRRRVRRTQSPGCPAAARRDVPECTSVGARYGSGPIDELIRIPAPDTSSFAGMGPPRRVLRTRGGAVVVDPSFPRHVFHWPHAA